MGNIDQLNTLLADVNLLSGNMSAAPLATATDTIETYKNEREGHPQADRQRACQPRQVR